MICGSECTTPLRLSAFIDANHNMNSVAFKSTHAEEKKAAAVCCDLGCILLRARIDVCQFQLEGFHFLSQALLHR